MTTQAHNILVDAINALKVIDLSKLDSGDLVPLVKQVQDICSFSAALHAQIELRAIGNGELIPGVVVKPMVTHRKWHDPETAEQLAMETFGDAAFDIKLKSPAQIEKLPNGDVFVSMASYKPEAGMKVVY